jgi:hypothetical protein
MMRFDGGYDRAHWIPQQRIKRAFKSRGMPAAQIKGVLRDPRIITFACRAHHTRFDSLFFTLEEHQYPECVAEWAAEYGFFFHSPRGGWRELYAGSLVGRQAA